ncbi:MAG: hypothetical protein ACSLEL_01350 [Candidatus Malihini olakiniferum]
MLKSTPMTSPPNLGIRFSLNEKDEATAIAEVEILRLLLDKYFKYMMTVREYKTIQKNDLDLQTGRVNLVIVCIL